MYVQRVATLGYGYVSPIVEKMRSKLPLVDSAATTMEEYVPAALRSTDNYISMACRIVEVRVSVAKAKTYDVKARIVGTASKGVEKTRDVKAQVVAAISKRAEHAMQVKAQLLEKVSAAILPFKLRALAAKHALLERLSGVKRMFVESKDNLFASLRATLSKIATKLNIEKVSAGFTELTMAAKQKARALATQTGASIHNMLVKAFGGERVDSLLAKVGKYVSLASSKVTSEKKAA